jgi:glycerophosphoryl diester phosphodiesterase
MPLRSALRDRVTRTALGRFLQLWKPMAGWTAIVWAAELVLLAPLSGLVLGRLLIRGDRVVVSNVELVSWLLSPWGAAYVLVGGALAIMAAVLRYAGIFRILTDNRRGHPVSLKRTAFHLALQAPAIFRLCLGVTALAIIVLLPLAGGLGLIHTVFLGPHGLNYYREAAPPEWTRALWAGAGWGLVWGLPVLFVALRSLFALPAFLDGHRPLRSALRESWRRTAGKGGRLLRVLGLAILAWAGARAALDAALFWAAGLAVRRLGLPLLGMVYASAAYLISAAVLDTVVSFIGFAVVSAMLTKFYYDDGGPLRGASGAKIMAKRPKRTVRALRSWLRPRRSVPLLAGLLVLAGALTFVRLQSAPVRIEILIAAHRGAGILAPENSLSAIERSIGLGADLVEIDVQSTRDGVIVLFHDVDLMRLTGDSRRIRDLTYESLARIDIGRGFAPEYAGERIPTLEQCLERAKGRIGVQIELKYFGFDPRLAEECVRLVRAHGMEGEAVLMSLHPRGVRQLQELAPDIPVGYLSILSAGELARVDADFVGVPFSRATPAFMRAARRRSLPVYVWGVNRPDRMIAAIERGAAGLITDVPDVAVRLRDELLELSPAELLLLRFRKVWELPEGEGGGQR